jgi:hypothetical protein
MRQVMVAYFKLLHQYFCGVTGKKSINSAAKLTTTPSKTQAGSLGTQTV